MRNKMLLSGLLSLAAVTVFAFMKTSSKSISEENNIAGNEQGIQFIEADWKKALAEAKKQNKLIFLDAYASWCGPCKLLKRKTFPDTAASDFFNKHFINVAIDMEKGDGPGLGLKYEVNAYPTLIITNGDGNIVTYTQGYITPKQLIEFGKYGLKQSKK